MENAPPSLLHFYLRELMAFPGWLARTAGSHRKTFAFYLALFGLACAVPSFLPINHPLVGIVELIQIYILLALGLNVVVGFLGLLDLGYVSFLATGALTASLLLVLQWAPAGEVNEAGGVETLQKTVLILNLADDESVLTMPVGNSDTFTGSHPFQFPGSFFVIMLISGGVCAVLGLLRGLPTLRLTGDYFAIVTLGLAEIIYLLMLYAGRLTGGAFAIKLHSGDRPTFGGEPVYFDTRYFYFLTLAVTGLVILGLYRLQQSRVGRAWSAIRLDETAARTCGVNVPAYKMAGFAVSGFIGGVAGAVYVVWGGIVAVKALDVWQSVLILACVVLGGMGSIVGVVLGAIVLIGLGEALRYNIPIGSIDLRVPNEARFLIYGMLLVLMMRYRPQGLAPRTLQDRLARPKSRPEIAARAAALFQLRRSGQGETGAAE